MLWILSVIALILVLINLLPSKRTPILLEVAVILLAVAIIGLCYGIK
jgi:hypothetical protein